MTGAAARTVIYPVEAIADFWKLGEEEYNIHYAGINITGLGPSDEGWYVRYRHENLTYLFGPLGDQEAARQSRWDLEAVRDAVIRERPSLSTSMVDVVKFTFSGEMGMRGDQPYGGRRGGGRPETDGSGFAASPRHSGLWAGNRCGRTREQRPPSRTASASTAPTIGVGDCRTLGNCPARSNWLASGRRGGRFGCCCRGGRRCNRR